MHTADTAGRLAASEDDRVTYQQALDAMRGTGHTRYPPLGDERFEQDMGKAIARCVNQRSQGEGANAARARD